MSGGLSKIVEVLGGCNVNPTDDVYVVFRREDDSCEGVGVDADGNFVHETLSLEQYNGIVKNKLSEKGNRKVLYGDNHRECNFEEQ